MTNVKLLKAKMIYFCDGDFVNSLAEILAISRQTAAAKLNCEREFSQNEIAIIAKHYGLTDSEIRKIFIEGDHDESM